MKANRSDQSIGKASSHSRSALLSYSLESLFSHAVVTITKSKRVIGEEQREPI